MNSRLGEWIHSWVDKQMEEPTDAMDGPTNGYNAYKTRNMIASVICLEYMALSKDD